MDRISQDQAVSCEFVESFD